MAHRFSIFDFASIEAMHMGCVPVLTPVGGNRELIKWENGFFLNDSLDGGEFAAWENRQNLSALQEKNKEISERYFSDQAMLNSYKKIIDGLMETLK